MSVRLHFTTIGDGSRPVIFLHGLFGQGKNFTTVSKQLVTRLPQLRAILIDLPNHGRSGWTNSSDYYQQAEAVASFLQQQGFESADIVGHSMGGKVAMRLALSYPQRVGHLAVVDISPVSSPNVRDSFEPLVRAMQNLDLSQLTSRSEADQALSSSVPDPVLRGFLLQSLRQDKKQPNRYRWGWQMNLDALGAGLGQIGGWSSDGDESWDGPVLWVAGSASDYITAETSLAMRTLFPRTRLVTIKNSGHWVHSEQPDAFVATLASFLSPS